MDPRARLDDQDLCEQRKFPNVIPANLLSMGGMKPEARTPRDGAILASPRLLTASANNTFVRLQGVPSDSLKQITPRRIKILPPLRSGGQPEESMRTLQKLVSSDVGSGRFLGLLPPKRSCLRIIESHTYPSNPQQASIKSDPTKKDPSTLRDPYDAAAADLVLNRSTKDHYHATPLEKCRTYMLSCEDAQRPGELAEGIFKRQFCLPVQTIDSDSVWSRPILVYGEGATGVSKEFQDSLAFDSHFESGNLLSAHRIGAHEYEILLNPDHATTGHTQWYLFSVSNMAAGCTYHFHITNLNKPDSLYTTGQQPLFFSAHEHAREGRGWQRIGKDVKYVKNGRKRNGRPLFTLSFAIEFPQDGDKCLLAHCFPYTLSDLNKYLHVKQKASLPFQFRCDALCSTLAGNTCQVLTITAHGTSAELAARKGVFLSARVHPGESNSSLIMKGILDFLLGNTEEAAALRSACVFKIIPMLNPDGVVNGHYRCNLAGYDLNRHWHSPSKKTQPTIYFAKELLKEFTNEREIEMFVDIHGHSVKHNMFMYGCMTNKAEGKREEREAGSSPKAFLQLLQARSPHFSWRDSKFAVEKSKEHTGRVVVWREFGIRNSFTLEASLCGIGDGKISKHHFSAADFEAMGTAFGMSLAEHCAPRADPPALLPERSESQRGGESHRVDGATAHPDRGLTVSATEGQLSGHRPSSRSACGEERVNAEPSEVEDGGSDPGDSSSDDEDRIAEAEEKEDAMAGHARQRPLPVHSADRGPGDSEPAHAVQVAAAREAPAGGADSEGLAGRRGVGAGDVLGGRQRGQQCHSLIPFPPSSAPGVEADGRRLVYWQPSPRHKTGHPPALPATRTPREARRQHGEAARARDRGWAAAAADKTAANGSHGSIGGSHGEPGSGTRHEKKELPTEDEGFMAANAKRGVGGTPRGSNPTRAPPRAAKAGPGPGPPQPPPIDSPRPSVGQVGQQQYPVTTLPPHPCAAPTPGTAPGPPARPNLYPFPAQRRLRQPGRAEPRADRDADKTGPPFRPGNLNLKPGQGPDAYTGPPGVYVGGRWHQSAKPVGPSSKFLPIMLGAVPAP